MYQSMNEKKMNKGIVSRENSIMKKPKGSTLQLVDNRHSVGKNVGGVIKNTFSFNDVAQRKVKFDNANDCGPENIPLQLKNKTSGNNSNPIQFNGGKSSSKSQQPTGTLSQEERSAEAARLAKIKRLEEEQKKDEEWMAQTLLRNSKEAANKKITPPDDPIIREAIRNHKIRVAASPQSRQMPVTESPVTKAVITDADPWGPLIEERKQRKIEEDSAKFLALLGIRK
jgi:hypothetical protein